MTLFDTVNGVTTQVGTATVGSGGTWSTSVTLSGNGTNSIVAQDTDAASNIGSSTPVTFTLATAAPTIAITTPIAGDNIINKSEAAAGVTISGTATASSGGAAVNGQTATIIIVDNSNAIKDIYITPVTNGTWSVNVTAAQAQALADGSYSITANVTDAAGNAAPTASQAIALETLAPTVTISTTGATTNQAAQTISGSVIAGDAAVGSTVTLFDTVNGVTTQVGTATVGSGGTWSTSVTLSGNGTNSIVAQDTDAAGNTSGSAPVTFTLTTTLPTVAIAPGRRRQRHQLRRGRAAGGVPLERHGDGDCGQQQLPGDGHRQWRDQELHRHRERGRHRLERDDPLDRCARTGQRHRDGVGAGDRRQRQPVDGGEPDR